MIGKDKFIEFMNDYYEFEEIVNVAEEIFPNFFESKIVHYSYKWFEELIKSYFNEYGIDWINAYLYENCREYWIDEEHHEINSLDDLWELIKEYRI